MDNSNNRKVRITQNGSNVNRTAEVKAEYITPYQCKYPIYRLFPQFPQIGGPWDFDGSHIVLYDDFYGDLIKNKVSGSVVMCKWEDTTNKVEGYAQEGRFTTAIVYGNLHMTVSADAQSMSGTYEDPVKGTQQISFTRLTQRNPSLEEAYDDDPENYYLTGVIQTTTPAILYEDASTESKVRCTVPAGTKFIFVHVKLDANGNPAWYAAENLKGSIYRAPGRLIAFSYIAIYAPVRLDCGLL
jgi:hypothetical protein